MLCSFKWKMLRESGPYALLLLHLLIALVTWSLVNDSASSRDIRFTSFDIAQLRNGELTVETVGYHIG